jgi:hypothetical protein
MAWTGEIKGALTVQVLVQYVEVYQQIQAIQLSPDTDFTLHWRWSTDGAYSSCSAYTAWMLGQSSVLGARELWKTRAPNNCRFFMWLALLGRCWTVERRQRHGLQVSSSCILCYQEIEFIDHLLVQCFLSREVWFKALRCYGWHGLTLSSHNFFAACWTLLRKRVANSRQKAFDSGGSDCMDDLDLVERHDFQSCGATTCCDGRSDL